MHKLYYLSENGEIPTGQVSSTARLGRKWYNLVEIGDVVALTITGSERKFGEAVIVAKETLAYADVINNADHNHVAAFNHFGEGKTAAQKLEDVLKAAYGVEFFDPDELFTVLHILPLSDEGEVDDETELKAHQIGATLDLLRDCGVTAVEYETRIGEISELSRYELAALCEEIRGR